VVVPSLEGQTTGRRGVVSYMGSRHQLEKKSSPMQIGSFNYGDWPPSGTLIGGELRNFNEAMTSYASRGDHFIAPKHILGGV